MSIPPDRTYARDEVDLILSTAASSEHPLVEGSRSAGADDQGDLTLAEIQQIGAQAGIGADAISAATFSVALARAHASDTRFQLVHPMAGELPDHAWDQLADSVRNTLGAAEIRGSPGALEFEAGKKEGEAGRLLVSIRSRNGATTISVWSDAPHLSPVEVALMGVLGIPVALFPFVATASGQWPALSVAGAIGAAGAAIGAGSALLWQRWAAKRWQARIAALLQPIAARTSLLASRVTPPEDPSPAPEPGASPPRP